MITRLLPYIVIISPFSGKSKHFFMIQGKKYEILSKRLLTNFDKGYIIQLKLRHRVISIINQLPEG